ncbi:TPA: hypothetical protein ACMEVV_005533, partial [Klebsiella quasipneumoniae subsp. quasipneumoniae]
MIHLINDQAKIISSDQQIGGRLKVAFVPNYSLS